MALQTGTNQNENSEPTKIEEISGVAGATDLTNVTPKEEETTFTSAGNLFNSPIDPPTKKTSSPMREGEAAARRAVNGIDNTVGHDINNATPVASEAMGFLDSMAAHAPRDTRISRPIDQSVDFEKYKDYLTSNSFYFDGDSNLDKARAENQSNWAQARNATYRTLLNVVPEAIKQTANAFDFEDWSKADAETGNWVSDAMTSAQESVKDFLPIYRENPGQALDVDDFAYWMETGDSLVTSIGGFALSGYALGGGVSALSKGASGLAKIGALVADSVKNTRSFRTALGAIEARGTGEAVRGLTLNYLMNRSESLGIAAETYATVYEREYNKAIVEGKSNEEAKTTAKKFAAEGAAGSMKFNALNMILNTTSSNLFLKSAKVSSLIKKEGIGTAIGEVGKEGLEEYVNDLGQLYGEGLNTEAPLTFKAAMQRLGTAEGLESPILGFIGGAGQPALTKAGKYIQTTDNSSYVRNFNQYLLDNPITATNKEETLQKAVAYAQTQSDKDAKIGFFTNTANAGGQRTSTAQQLESLYVAQQVALSDYKKADKASNMNDVVNMSISSEFSVNLMNELSSDPNISPEQKDILLERALLSHQAYKAMLVGTMSELKDVYRTYSTMEAKEATDRGLLTDEVEGTPEHYKTKAKRALQTLDAYEANYNVSKGFVNSSEVYKALNDIHFATRTVKEASDKYNDKAAELDTLSRELFESEGDTEALEFYESVQASNRIAIHPKLKGTKIDEEIQDERKAVKVAKQNKLNSVVNFQTITSSTYTKNLNDLVKLYKNKQIAEANKTKATKTFSEGFKNVFTSKAKTTNAKANKTKNTSTTGGSNPNTTTPPATNTASAIAKAKAANNANANKGTVTPTPAPPVKTPNTNVKNPSVFTFDTSSITASTTMQMFVDGDTKKINGILNSGDSIETKIAKLEQDVENKIKYDRVGAKNLAPDGTEVIDSLIAKIQDKISELQNELVSLSPEVRESKEAYEALVTDFGLDLEEERLLSTDIVDEDGNAIENTKAVVDSKYDIYSSILEQMKNRGVDTSNFEDVMFDFKSILGDRLTQSEFNSLQGLYNFTNNTNHNSSYKEIFGTLGEIDNDIDTANRIAKVTLPEGRFTYDLDVESQMALQAERQAIIVENPNAEVKGLAFPIYNEEGGNKIAYLAQQYSKVARQEVNKDGETYTLVDKVTTTGLLNVDLDSKTLEPDFFNVNDVITFMPLESFVNEDGETIMADTLPVSEKPVGLIINGELVQGLFLHTTSWINATNINNTSEHIEQDRLSLLALRTKIFNGESVTAKITEVSTGAPIKNPNNSSRTFLSEFATHPVGIIRNGLLETSSGIIEVPEYLSFPEGSVVIKVGDYFHYGSRVGLFAPMRQAIITGIRAFATGVESEGTKYLKQNQGLDATTSKGLEGYVRQLVNVSPVKVGESYPTNLEEFITALNTRPETEVYVNFIKGDLYIGRGQGLDVIQISQKGYAHDTRSLDVLLNEIDGLLQESYANVDLPSLKTNESIVIIGEAGITRTFDTYDEYVKQVSTSIYGSIDLPSGTNITTIQKRVSFETETIDAESNPKKKRAYKKRETKKAPIVIDNPTGTQTTIEFNTTVASDSIIDDITDDFSPDVIDATTANTNEVAYNLKAINILSTDKAKQIFEKGIKNNWDLNKILIELQIPKEQKQLILDKGFKVLTINDARILKKPDVILPIGTSGSGKSTFIKSLPQENLVVIEPDAMRVEFTGDINDKSKDKEIYEEAAKRAVQAIKQGKQVVFDTTNLTKDKRLPFIEAIKKALPNANIQYKLMELNPELAKQRIKADITAGKNRANVPDATIDRHAESYKQMLEDIKNEPISNIEEEPNDNLREEIITSLLADNSFVVEINTTKEKDKGYREIYNPETGDVEIEEENDGDYTIETEEDENGNVIGVKYVAVDVEKPNSSYNSNLTVPGGTNYTENEIATPLITPSIKGHADFATDNGIGWFRSDEQTVLEENLLNNLPDAFQVDFPSGKFEYRKENNNWNLYKLEKNKFVLFNKNEPIEEVKEAYSKDYNAKNIVTNKTRRILEIQSDLFQKGRDKEDLITVEQFENSNDVSYEHTETGEIISGEDLFYGGYTEVEKSKYKIKPFDNEQNKDTNKNQFLQLLNKDSNWVNFFVKSIIQDSAKKGYEKVLFPSGNTASRVEGHTTLEEFKKQKEDRIKELEFTIEKTNNKEFIDRSRENLFYSDDVTDEQIKKELTTDYNREIAQRKQELEEIEGPGGFGALKPIYNFYENAVTNILNKTYGKNNVKLITDEYGNTWNEVTIENIPTTVDLSPTVEEPLVSPSLIPGLSNKLQQIIIQDIVLDYYGLLIKATKNKDKVGKLEDFYDKKVAEFDEVVLTLEQQNYAGIIKVRQQVETIKANKAKILEIARQNLTKQLGVRVNEGNLELDNTNDSTASNDEEIDAPDGIPAEDASERSRIYDANEFGIDPKLSMSNSIRHMLYGIVDAQLGYKQEMVREVVDGVEQERVVQKVTINYRKVPLQVPVYVNANEVYEDLVKLFAKSSINVGMDVEGFIPDVNSKLHPKIQVAIEILKSKYTIKPYYSNVVDKLENMDMETQLNFIRAFNKNVTDHIKVIEYLDKDGQSLSLKIIKNSTQNAVNNLKQKWNINLKAISGYVPNDDYMTLNPVIYQAFTNSYNKIKGDTDLHTYENFKNMFSVIGITLSNAAFEKLRAGVFVGGKPKNLNQQFEHTQGYFNRIKKQVDYIMNGGPNGTAIDVNLLYQDKVFTEFANFLMDFDKSVFNNSYTNGNGDTIYGITNNRYFMERFIGLKNNLKLLKNLKNNKFSSKSAWLNNLYNENNGAINKGDFHDTFSYSTLDSYTVRETNKSKMVDTLTRVEMVKLGISLFMNKGRNILNNTIPISKFIIPALSDKTNLFVVEAQGRFYSLNNNKLLGTDLNFLRSQLFEGEFLRIIEAQAKGPIGVNGYDTGSNKFLLFPLFNDIEGLFNEGRINVDALNDPIIVARINEVIMDYIITGSTDVYNDWQAMKLLKPGKIDESTGITIYSEKMDFMDSNYAKFASKHVRQTMEEGKSLALNYHINYLVANANMQQLIFNDPAYYYKKANEEKGTTDIQETFDNTTKRYAAVNGGKDDFIFPAGSTFDVLSIQDANVVSSRHDYLESLWAGHPDFVETMKSYSNMTSGDAQEYTSLEEHLDRMIYGNMISEETGKRVLKTYKETGSVSKEDLGRILIPFKPLYFNTYPGTDGIMRTLYIKTSSLPLIKELTKGTQLDALREYLDNPKTTPKVAVFESGIKAGKPTKSLALFDEKGNLDAKALKGNLNAHIITKIPREGHGNQQANPDKSLKSVVNDGTQQAKLLFTNILDVLGFKNPFAVKGEENKTISGRELATMYLNRYEDRFKKQYDKLVKELKIDANGNIGNMAKLQKLLVDEAVSRGWTFNESSSFELDDTGLNFKIPLWMSISSVKIESLLSSIVDNRIRKRKRYGRAYILASDAGVRTYNPEVDNASTGIVFTEDFTGELKNSYNDNGEMTSAEVLVPFRFYDNKGNLLKITDFMVDGKLDTNKLPKELLTGFGYRIPTSGVNLMSNIKIVGFLPESYGDVVIAPADFTVQMGSDFDVDKMYSNTYATFYDSKLGKLTRLDQSHIKQKDDITKAINLLFKEIKLYSKYKGKKKADIIKELNNQIKVLRDTEIYKIKDLDILVLDNEITDIQRAVLNNVATEVQRARTKPLSFGRLPEMIKKFGLSFDTTYYSFLNRNVQDTSYLNGNLGKTAVGNFSLDMILNSLGQYIKTPVYFQHKVKIDETRYKYVRTPIKAFGFVGNNINEPYLNDGSGRYKSDVLEGLMAAALDNGKEQILGKLGISDKTFDFIRAMVATGYNEEVIMGILAQPIMKLYLDPVTDSKVKAQMEQATRLIKKKTTFLKDTALDELTTSLYDYNIYKANLDEFGKALVKSVKDGTSESFSKTTQVAILTMYLAMESKGQSLNQVRSALNVDSAGVGKNIIYSTAKLEQHEKTLENPSINNIEKYFVNYKYNEETDTSEKDFVSIGNSALFYAARTNAKLWGKFFPFSNKTMEKVVKTIAKRTGKDIFRLNSYSDYATLVLRDFKSFLSAANLPKALPSFMKDMSNKDIYKSIILSSPSNQSLGEFILNLRENTSNSIKYSNDLLDGLDIDSIDNSLSTNVNPILVNIGYSNNKRIDNNEDNIVNAISEMINEPVDLGTWNGNPITSKDLANILIAYQLISRGVPGSNKFIQFIPTEQLRRLGYYESMSDNYRALLGFNSTSNSKANSAQFIMQHLQHNMADYYEPSADRTHKDSFENGVYVGENFKNMPTYIVFKEDGTYYAQHKTKTGFIRLNPLGWGPNTEYNHDVYNPVSINPDNNKSMINVTTIKVEDNSTDVTAPFVNKALGNILINSSLGKQTVIDVVTGYNENTEEDVTTEMKAYPITLTENGSTVDYFLVKNGSTYNSLYHPVTQYMIPINGLTASTTKVERDIKIMESLAELNPLDVETLGLTEEVETSNIAAIEANIKEFMTPSRDKSEDVFPDDINTVTREFADELGLSDTSLNLEDKYRLIFSRIIGTVGSSNKVLSYFLSRAADIIPLLSSTPIVLDTTLKAKGMYNSNGYIVINPNKFTTIEDMANVIAHEAIHGLFKKQVKVKNPIVKDLERFRKEVEAELVVEFGQEAIDNMKAKLKMGVPLTAGIEADLLYPILNVDELITGVLTNPAFQTYLNSKEMKLAKKSLWTKVLELMSSMLRVLGVKENSKLEDSLGAIFALTNDIRDNHLNNIPNPKYQRSLAFINERFNLVSNTNTLLPKGNAQQIVDFINSNFANTTATVVEGKYVEIIPTVFLSPSTTNGDLSSDVWDLEFINDEMDNTQASTKESKGNYYTYAASLRARVIQGEHILNKAKVSQDIIAIEEATNSLMEDKVSLINIRRIQSFADFAMRAKEDYAKVSAILDGPMNSEDITYARNILNFWKDVREYSFTSKHRESEQLMRTFGIIEDEAETAIKRLELIEKNYLEDFIKDTIGKDITLDDLFATYSDIDIVSSYVRDISTYDNDLLTSIWKRVQLANMEAETESETLLKSLNTIIDKVMPKLKAINSKDPYEIFRQLSENGLKTNHLINAYSSKFYSDRGRAYTLAKNGQDFATVNNYANWIKAETKAFKLSEYFPSGGVITPEVLANREALRQEVGDFAYNMWFNGQSKKLNSYNKRKDAIIATIKADNGMELSDDITSNPKALQAITNWSKKHSPYEFSNVVNNSNYNYQYGSDGIDGFSTYEILPNKPEHFNKDFEVIANDADLLEFYNEFSSIYESLKLHVPASQFANLIFGGLPVIEQSIYQAYSTKGLKGLFKGIKTAWANSITSTITKEGATELDLVTGDNSKQMFIPGIKSNSNAIKTYVNTKAIAYEVKTGSLPSQALLAQYREEAVNELANKGDFDLGKLMKVFGTLVIAHKQIASVENLIKIGQYTLNSYKENQFNSDGSIATRSGGGNAVLPAENSFPNTKKSFTYFINSQVYGNVKDEEMVFERKKYTAEEDELKASLDKSLQELEAKYEAGEVTETFYNSLKNSIVRNVDNLGKNVVGSKIGDNWLKYVQLKLMGWNILGGFSNSAFGFIGNMIEAAGEGSFTLSEMNEAYRMTASSVAKNLSFDKLKLGESGKIRSAMDKLNVLKEASHELYTSNEATSFGGKFKFASPYNMNQRTEYLNQAPLMIVIAKKTMVDTIGGRISIWDGMNADWEWDEATYGPMPTKVILDMRVAITKHIQRIHGNYDPASPLMIKKTIAGRAVSQFRTWLYEAVAVRFEKERMEHAIGTTVKGRYRTVGGLIFENEGRIGGLELTKEFSKALLNSFTFGAIKLKSFENTKLSDIDSQNMRKVAMELVLLLDVYIIIAMLKAGLSDDEDEAKGLYNVLLNQGTRLKSDLLLYINPIETRNILKDIIPAVSLFDDTVGFMKAVTNLEEDTITTGVHQGNSKLGTATMKLLPGTSKFYSSYNAWSQIFDKDIKISKKDDNTEE